MMKNKYNKIPFMIIKKKIIDIYNKMSFKIKLATK